MTIVPALLHLLLIEDGRRDETPFPDGRGPGDVRNAWRGALPGALMTFRRCSIAKQCGPLRRCCEFGEGVRGVFGATGRLP